MTSHITSCIEYLLPTYGILVLLVQSNFTRKWGKKCSALKWAKHHTSGAQFYTYAVFHLSRPAADSILKPVSVFTCKILWTVWFWSGCLGNESYDISVPAKRVSAKTFTLYSHVPYNVLYAKLQIAHNIYNKIIQQFVNRKSALYSLLDSAILVSAVNRLETSLQGLIRTGFGLSNEYAHNVDLCGCRIKYVQFKCWFCVIRISTFSASNAVSFRRKEM